MNKLSEKKIADYSYIGAGRPGTHSVGLFFLLAKTRYLLLQYGLGVREKLSFCINVKGLWNTSPYVTLENQKAI